MQRSKAATAGLFLGALAGVAAGLLLTAPAVMLLERCITDRLLAAFARRNLGRTSRVSIVQVSRQERAAVGALLEELARRRVAALLLLDEEVTGPEERPETAGAALAEHLLAARRVVLPAFVEAEGAASSASAQLPEKSLVAVYGRADLLPAPESVRFPGRRLLEAADRVGVDSFPAGETVRTIPVAYGVGGKCVPSIPVAVAMTAFGESSLNIVAEGRLLKSFAGIDLPLDGKGGLLLNYRGPGGTFRSIDAARLISALEYPDRRCAWLRALSKGDIVVLDVAGADPSRDRATPTGAAMPVSEILATAIDNIVRGDPLHRPGPILLRFVAVLAGALAGLLGSTARRLAWILPGAAGLLLLHFLSAVFLLQHGVVIEFLSPFVATALALPGVALFLRAHARGGPCAGAPPESSSEDP